MAEALEAIVALEEKRYLIEGFRLVFEFTGEVPRYCRRSEEIGLFKYLGPDKEGNHAIYFEKTEIDGPISYLCKTLLNVTKDKDKLREIIYAEAKRVGEEEARKRNYPGHVNVTFQDKTKYAKQTTSKPTNQPVSPKPDDDSYAEENAWRQENDLPPVNPEVRRQHLADEMDDKYGYDVGK